MAASKGSLRNQLRNVHILASVALGAFIYSPWRNSPIFSIVMGAGVFPILTLTGVWMWQGPRIRNWFRKQTDAAPKSS